MSGSDLPDDDGWVPMLETTLSGCHDPTREDERTASYGSDDSDWSSTGPNSPSENEAIGEPKESPGSEGTAYPRLDQPNNSPPPRYGYKTFTANPLQSDSTQRDQLKKTAGIQTPPSSPILPPVGGQNGIGPLSQKPRTAPDPLNVEELRLHFPDWSQEKIEGMILEGERYRDAAYSRRQNFEGSNAQDPEHNHNHKPQDGLDPEHR